MQIKIVAFEPFKERIDLLVEIDRECKTMLQGEYSLIIKIVTEHDFTTEIWQLFI